VLVQQTECGGELVRERGTLAMAALVVHTVHVVHDAHMAALVRNVVSSTKPHTATELLRLQRRGSRGGATDPQHDRTSTCNDLVLVGSYRRRA